MSITFKSEFVDGMLCTTATGRDDDLQQVIDYGTAIIDLANECGARLILCDETKLVYTLGTFDTFQLAQTIAERTKNIVRVAIVCSPDFLEDGKFWETVALNRFLQVRVDTDIERARAWLLNNPDQSQQ
jgi:hypothetical protein